MSSITRRQFLKIGALAAPAALGIDARFIEPTALRVRELPLNNSGNCRFVHFTDLHYKGDAKYAAEIVRAINAVQPEFVCFTGDIVEQRQFADAALGFIREIKAPVYGCPGNHEYSSGISFRDCEAAFAATGGAWLMDRNLVLPQHNLEIVGMGIVGLRDVPPLPASRRLLLMHYPRVADHLGDRKFDLILAGHSHGGQVRLPFCGALILPRGVGKYDLGYYKTNGGPLHVSAGVGTYVLPIRLNCPPEITLITI
ncbi:MAG TPA: metallophosphoesterase [Chthoniobacterales bacterium]|nr:metallophosphoesterase [Chthoniobacterales bacterium]